MADVGRGILNYPSEEEIDLYSSLAYPDPAQDLLDRIYAELELEEKREKLQELDKQKSHFHFEKSIKFRPDFDIKKKKHSFVESISIKEYPDTEDSSVDEIPF